MKKIEKVFVLVFLVALFCARGVSAETIGFIPGALYGTDGYALYIIDKATGDATRIGTHGELDGSSLVDLAFDPQGNLYGISMSVTNPWTYEEEYEIVVEARLYKISPGTGLAVGVGQLGIGIIFEGGLCFSDNGTLYGANQGDASAASLFTINPLSGAGSTIGRNAGYSRDINGLAYDGDKLYALERKTNTLGTIDTLTGAFYPIGMTGLLLSVGNAGGLAFDRATGKLYAALNGGMLCTINKETGAATFISLMLPQQGLAFAPPSAWDITFAADAADSSVTLTWKTASEDRIGGFTVYRSRTVAGDYVPVHEGLIPAKGTSQEGAEYELVDTAVENRRRYYYALTVTDTDGEITTQGLVSALPLRIRGR